MNFATLPWWMFAAGVPVIAGALYLLQRLRSERRHVAFAAASLWAQMPRVMPHRVLGRTFRYWLAFLLSLAIALLLWAATANPAAGPPSGDAARIYYLDASAVLAGDDAAAAKRALLADVRATPAGQREVVLGDATGTPLLAPGESVSLLAARLDKVSAGARPSTFRDWLGRRAARVPAGRTLAVVYYGGWGAVRTAAARSGNIRISHGYLAQPVPDNRGIVALGASPAASGRWGRADVLIGVAGRVVPADLAIDHGDGRIDATALAAIAPGRFLLRDVSADGATLAVRLRDGDGFAVDDHASLRLPDRARIKVAFGASVPATIRGIVGIDEGVVVVTDAEAADVVVRGADDRTGGDRPALVLSAPADGAAFTFTAPDERPGGDLSMRLAEFGLDQVDAPALAEALDRPIGVDVQRGETRRIAVWAPLFAGDSSFARSPAMPLFVSGALRWLSGEATWTPYAAAGSPLPGGSALDGWSAGRADAGLRVDAEATPGDAGPMRTGGRALDVSFTDPGTTAAVAIAPPADVPVRDPAPMLPPNLPFVVLVLLAFIALAGEWIAYQRRRIP